MPFNLSMGELLVLLVVSILLFGGRLPEVARTIGQTIASFKRGMSAEMSRLDLDLRGRDAVPYRPARHLGQQGQEPQGRPSAAPGPENGDEGTPNAGIPNPGPPDPGSGATRPPPDDPADDNCESGRATDADPARGKPREGDPGAPESGPPA